MTQVFMEITGAQGRVQKTGLLTAGMVGVPVQFSFSPEWAELNCLAVFRAGEVKKDNAITDGCSVIPAEVLQQPGQRLYLGVEGRSKQGDVVIPTVWAEVGQILEGAQAANDPALAPTPSQFERFMAQVEQVDEKIKAALQDVNISAAGAFTIVVTDMRADKTNGEIYEAYQAAKPAYLQAVIEEVPYIFRPVSVLPEMALFTMNSGTAGVVLRIIRDEVSIEYQELAKRQEIPTVPENVSAFYNDKGYQTAAEVESIVEEAMKDIPAGGGGGATDPVEAWKVLASATIAKADAVGGAWVDTGLTFGDLKQYKEIIFRIGTPNSGPNLLNMRVLIKTNQAVDWYSYPCLFGVVASVKSANIAKISFANSQKDIWSCVIGVGSSYDAFQNDLGANNPFLTGNAATPYELYGMQTYHKKSSAMSDSDHIQFYFNAAAPADIRYKITGVFQ